MYCRNGLFESQQKFGLKVSNSEHVLGNTRGCEDFCGETQLYYYAESLISSMIYGTLEKTPLILSNPSPYSRVYLMRSVTSPKKNGHHPKG